MLQLPLNIPYVYCLIHRLGTYIIILTITSVVTAQYQCLYLMDGFGHTLDWPKLLSYVSGIIYFLEKVLNEIHMSSTTF